MTAPPIQYARTEDGVNIAYWTLGSGPSVIVADTVGLSHLTLEWEVPAMRRYYNNLAETFQVVRYAQRGSTLSDESDLSFDGAAADLVSVVDAIGQDRVTLLPGHGGIVGVGPFALRFPDRVDSIVALEPALGLDRSAKWNSMLVAMTHGAPEQYAEVIVRFFDPESVDPRGPLERLVTAVALGSFQLEVREQISAAVTQRLGDLQSPCLVVDWPDAPWSEGAQLASRVPAARLIVRQGRGHYLYDSDPGNLMTVVREFILQHVQAPVGLKSAAPEIERSDTTRLSPRELAVLRGIADASTNAEIAEALVISPSTVARHVSNMLAKTGLKNRADLTRYAVENGLTTPDV